MRKARIRRKEAGGGGGGGEAEKQKAAAAAAAMAEKLLPSTDPRGPQTRNPICPYRTPLYALSNPIPPLSNPYLTSIALICANPHQTTACLPHRRPESLPSLAGRGVTFKGGCGGYVGMCMYVCIYIYIYRVGTWVPLKGIWGLDRGYIGIFTTFAVSGRPCKDSCNHSARLAYAEAAQYTKKGEQNEQTVRNVFPFCGFLAFLRPCWSRSCFAAFSC